MRILLESIIIISIVDLIEEKLDKILNYKELINNHLL